MLNSIVERKYLPQRNNTVSGELQGLYKQNCKQFTFRAVLEKFLNKTGYVALSDPDSMKFQQ